MTGQKFPDSSKASSAARQSHRHSHSLLSV
jgi:hypothetical protein